MILVKDILYFFQNDGNFINSVNLTSSINGKHYYLIPYKVEGKYLHYLISYPIDNTYFGLIYCKFDLNSPNSNEIIKSQTIKPLLGSEVRNYEYNLEKLEGVICLFMNPSSIDLLTCFYSTYFSSMMDKEENKPKKTLNDRLKKIVNLVKFKNH